MKNQLKTLSIAFLLFLLIGIFGCGGSNNTPYSPIVTGTTSGTTGTVSTADFAVSVSPSSQTMQNGNIGTTKTPGTTVATNQVSFTVTVSAKNGFIGNVGLSVSSNAGFTAAFQKTPLTLDATHATASTVCTITRTQALTKTGNVPFTITSVSGAVSHSSTATVVLVQGAPSFTVKLVPTSEIQIADNGAKRGVTLSTNNVFDVQVSAFSGFTGTVKLSVSSIPQGITGTLASTSVVLSSSKTTVDVPLELSGFTDDGHNPFTVTGVSGSLTSSDSGDLLENFRPTFQINVVPNSINLADQVGSSTTATVELKSISGFDGDVTLSYVSQTYGYFLPLFGTATVHVPANGTVQSTLKFVTNDAKIVDGSYPVVVSGTSGTQTEMGDAVLTLGKGV